MPLVTQEGLVLVTAWQELACKMLETIGVCGLRADCPSYQQSQEALSEILGILKGGDPSLASVPSSALKVAENLQELLRRSQQSWESSAGESQALIKTLLECISGSERQLQDTVAKLGSVHERITQAETPEELEAARPEVQASLSELLAQAAKQVQEAQELQAQIKNRISDLEVGGAAGGVSSQGSAENGEPPHQIKLSCPFPPDSAEPKDQFDPVTGLPNKEAFAELLLALPATRAHMYVGVFYFQRMEYINARYGDSVGDEVLMFCAQLLATKILRPSEQLFRWRGPSFCALIERKGTLADVRKDTRSHIGTRVQFIGSDDSVLLNIGVASEIRSADTLNLQDILQELEKFVLLPSTRI